MTNSKLTASLDEVLAEYARVSQEFDAKLLQAFIEKYPEHAMPLQRYAQIQLTSVPATPEEIDSEMLTYEEMLPQQSKLLQRMQQMRGLPSPSEAAAAVEKLAAISGEKAVGDVAVAVFGSSEHGEDLLIVSVTDASSEVSGVPPWFYEGLGDYVGIAPVALVKGLEMKRQQRTGLQRFSTKDKPAEAPPVTWEQLVEDCISDESAKRAILERSERS